MPVRFVHFLAAAFVGLATLSARADPDPLAAQAAPAAGDLQPTPGGSPPPPHAAPAPPSPVASTCQPLDGRPTHIDCDLGKNIPPGYRLESHARRGLLISGGIIAGIGYGFSSVVAVSKSVPMNSDRLGSDEVPYEPGWLLMPVLGPWIALTTMKSYNCLSQDGRYYSASACRSAKDDANVWLAVLIVDGLVQLTGATLATVGMVFPRQQLVVTDSLKAQVVPARLGNSGHGLALVGTFGGP